MLNFAAADAESGESEPGELPESPGLPKIED